VSTGNQSLDDIIGGLVIGSITILVEDNISHYYGHFLKTYLGEGIVRDHKCLILDPESMRTLDYWERFLP